MTDHLPCAAEIHRLQTARVAAEKRADEAERQLGECSGGYETLEKELATALVVANNYQSLMVAAKRETGEARAALQRIADDERTDDDRMEEGYASFARRLQRIARTALHRSQGE